ncbi:hypothetical protein NPIL_468041 [Nephila pilipes]|uniref:Uncharacterized protein n=1 Tax=Nephila pilipes TaxID=299642 RepID=A0A8X6NVX5_NEPPI|nr:hypothetical protein NPIL_468041 [Nephila pilipes]
MGVLIVLGGDGLFWELMIMVLYCLIWRISFESSIRLDGLEVGSLGTSVCMSQIDAVDRVAAACYPCRFENSVKFTLVLFRSLCFASIICKSLKETRLGSKRYLFTIENLSPCFLLALFKFHPSIVRVDSTPGQMGL